MTQPAKLSVIEAKNLINKIADVLCNGALPTALELLIKENLDPTCAVYLLYDRTIILKILDLMKAGLQIRLTGADGCKKDLLKVFFNRIEILEKEDLQTLPRFLKPGKTIELPRLFKMRNHLNTFLRICIWIELRKKGITDQFKEKISIALYEKSELDKKIRKRVPIYNWINAHNWPGDIEEFQSYVKRGLSTSKWELPSKKAVWTKPMEVGQFNLIEAMIRSQAFKTKDESKRHTQTETKFDIKTHKPKNVIQIKQDLNDWSEVKKVQIINDYRINFFAGHKKIELNPTLLPSCYKNGKPTRRWGALLEILYGSKVNPKERFNVNKSMKEYFRINSNPFSDGKKLPFQIIKPRHSAKREIMQSYSDSEHDLKNAREMLGND